MADELKLLNNIRSLRAVARELPLELLEAVLEKVRLVVTERQEEESSRQTVQNERNEKLEKLRLMMLEAGIDPSELVAYSATSTKPKKERTARTARYQYQDENSQTKTWTGHGRTPKAIAEQIAAGKSLDDFLIG